MAGPLAGPLAGPATYTALKSRIATGPPGVVFLSIYRVACSSYNNRDVAVSRKSS